MQIEKKKLSFIVPIIIAIILLAIFGYLDYIKEKKATLPQGEGEETLEGISPSIEDEQEDEGEPNFSSYGCAGPQSINLSVIKKPDTIWPIKRNGQAVLVSLGKYRINPPDRTVLKIPKIWLYFESEDLSDREDNFYGLEKSYVSRIILKVNGAEREINLGGDEYMFIELGDNPLGDFYPYKSIYVEFEFLVELKCSDLDKKLFGKNICLDNQGETIDHLDGKEIRPNIRIFATGCEDFLKEIEMDVKLDYQ